MKRKKKLNRRQFIGTVGAGVAITGCTANSTIPDFFPPITEPSSEDSTETPEIPEIGAPATTVSENSEVLAGTLYPTLDLKTILLNRSTFGPTQANVTEINTIGYQPYLEKQLAYTTIDDSLLDARLAQIPVLSVTPSTISNFTEYEAIFLLGGAAIMRAIHTKRQLFERMVEFWSDHFNISPFNGGTAQFKVIDDREVIRQHALGKFRDLLGASAKSPAMLRFLDNEKNRAGRPNENYARELLELHTVGVAGGYTQNDVQNLARAFTGWTIAYSGPAANTFEFRPDYHDNGPKQIMGLYLPPNGGIMDGEKALDYLASHTATSRFIASKLVSFFLSETPPTALIDQAANIYRSSGGNIKSVVRVVLADTLIRYATAKVKRPFYLLAEVARKSGVQAVQPEFLTYWAGLMGHRPFGWSTPDGYPQQSGYWAPGLLPRWNVMMTLAMGQAPSLPISAMSLAQANGASTPQQVVDLWNRLFHGNRMPTADKQALLAYIQRQPNDNHRKYVESLALAWSLPAFQTF